MRWTGAWAPVDRHQQSWRQSSFPFLFLSSPSIVSTRSLLSLSIIGERSADAVRGARRLCRSSQGAARAAGAHLSQAARHCRTEYAPSTMGRQNTAGCFFKRLRRCWRKRGGGGGRPTCCSTAISLPQRFARDRATFCTLARKRVFNRDLSLARGAAWHTSEKEAKAGRRRRQAVAMEVPSLLSIVREERALERHGWVRQGRRL